MCFKQLELFIRKISFQILYLFHIKQKCPVLNTLVLCFTKTNKNNKKTG